MSEQWCSWFFIDGRAYLTKGVYPLVLYCLDHDYNFDYTKYELQLQLVQWQYNSLHEFKYIIIVIVSV